MCIRIKKKIQDTTREDRKSYPKWQYENFVDAHGKAASKYISTNPRTKYRVPWETLAVRKNLHSWKMPPKAIGRTQQTQMHEN